MPDRPPRVPLFRRRLVIEDTYALTREEMGVMYPRGATVQDIEDIEMKQCGEDVLRYARELLESPTVTVDFEIED